MARSEIKYLDVQEGGHHSRLRLLAPLRYLEIRHPEKQRYDLVIPTCVGIFAWILYVAIQPRADLFGEAGLLRFARDLLIMGVPFMIGSLATVSMGLPGPHLDRRPIGADLWLDNDALTMRQFLCFLLGYLSFLGLVTLFAVVGAGLTRNAVVAWTEGYPIVRAVVWSAGTCALSMLLSYLSVTVLWALYFLTDVANRKGN